MSAPSPPASLTSRFSLKYLRCPALTVVLALPCSPRKSCQLTSELGILGWLGALSTLNLALLGSRSAQPAAFGRRASGGLSCRRLLFGLSGRQPRCASGAAGCSWLARGLVLT